MLYGRTPSGTATQLTMQQRMERPGEPVILLVEKDRRIAQDFEPKFRHNKWRAVAAMYISGEIMVANASAHGPNKEVACEKAVRRCKEAWKGGAPPVRIHVYGRTEKEKAHYQRMKARKQCGDNQ